MKNINTIKFRFAIFILITAQIACALFQRGYENIVLPDKTSGSFGKGISINYKGL